MMYHEQFGGSTMEWYKAEDYFLPEVCHDENVFTCTEVCKRFRAESFLFCPLEKLAQFWGVKSGFVLKIAWPGQFGNCYIHLCLCTEQAVLLLEMLSKLSWYYYSQLGWFYYSHCHPSLCYTAKFFQHSSRSRRKAQEGRNSFYINDLDSNSPVMVMLDVSMNSPETRMKKCIEELLVLSEY